SSLEAASSRSPSDRKPKPPLWHGGFGVPERDYRRRAKGRDSARREMRCPRPQSYEFPAGIALNAGVALRHQRRRVLARARVAFPCQLARFVGLLDSPVAVIPLSDAFDVRPHVLATRGDKEACAIAPDLLAFAVRVPRPQA